MHIEKQNLQNLTDYSPHNNLLEDKLIVITGASDGIGRALSIACAKYGASVILMAKNENKLNALLSELEQNENQNHQTFPMDFATAGEADYLKFTDFLTSLNQPINSLILNAGYFEALQGLRNYQLDIWLRTVTVNQHSAFMLIRHCIPILEASIDPSIVFSTHDCNKAYWGAYAVAKSAQLSMMKILAEELDGEKMIRVNGVDPAPVRTKLRMLHYPGVNPKEYAAPEDITTPYLYFIGPDSQGVTGMNYKINPEFQG